MLGVPIHLPVITLSVATATGPDLCAGPDTMKHIRMLNLALLFVSVLCVQTSRAQDDNPFSLPEGALARLGKGGVGSGDRAVAYSPLSLIHI